MYGQRVIAALLDFCKDIREVAEPGAIMLNYSNPNAMATWACNKYGKVKTIGLCHGEIHGEMQIAEVLGIPREELDITCAGINHQTWYIAVKHHGEDMLPKLLPGFEAHEKFSEEEKVRIDILKRFGYLFHGVQRTSLRICGMDIANARMRSKTGSIWTTGSMARQADICA